MTRIKRGVMAKKRKKNVLKKTKGFRWGRSKKYKAAKEALTRAGVHAYRDRKKKKRNNRALWQIKISEACKKNDISYNKFINKLKKEKIEIDRKILADLIENNPKVFQEILKT